MTDHTVPLPYLFSSSPPGDRVVRFDSECILIPEVHKRPLIITKSYSLPLWRKKLGNTDLSAPGSPPQITPLVSESPHIIVKVPVPAFRTKPRSASHGCDTKPLSPCIVYRDPTSPRFTALGHRQSLSADHVRSKPDLSPKLPTIPLRPCCHNCFPITEESTKEGEAWKVKFTYGARRRMRSASLSEAHTVPSGSQIKGPRPSCPHTQPKDIQVDEVDKRLSMSLHGFPALHARDDSTASNLFPLPSPPHSPSESSIHKLMVALDDDVSNLLDSATPLSRKDKSSHPAAHPAMYVLDSNDSDQVCCDVDTLDVSSASKQPPVNGLSQQTALIATDETASHLSHCDTHSPPKSLSPIDELASSSSSGSSSDLRSSSPEPMTPPILPDSAPELLSFTTPPSSPRLSSPYVSPYSPSFSPGRPSKKTRKGSFTASVRRAGADVIRGVSTMGGIGVVGRT